MARTRRKTGVTGKGRATPVRQGTKAIMRISPRRISWLRTYATGKELLILGPSGAGKTTFAEYLRLGILEPEGKQEMTYAITKSPTFSVAVGSHGAVVLKVRRAVDPPGQVGPLQHATLVGRRRPHAVIVMLDASKTISATIGWLRLFCDRLDTVLRKKPSAQRKLSEIVVVLNKRDKINKKRSDKVKRDVQKVLSNYLSVVLGTTRVRSIPVSECISVKTKRRKVSIDNVITDLAARLAGQDGRVKDVRAGYSPVGKVRKRNRASRRRR